MPKSQLDCLIAQVLKPYNDVRSCKKIAPLLSGNGKKRVGIMGAGDPIESEEPYHFIPLGKLSRFSGMRFLASFVLLKAFLSYRPKLLWVSAIELAPMSILIKIAFPKTILVYDRRENYRKNVKYQSHYPKSFKVPILFGIQFIEFLMDYLSSLLVTAERSYSNELNLASDKVICLQNKSVDIPLPIVERKKHTFLLCGTLSETYGTLKGIEWFLKWNKIHPDTYLEVLGYAPETAYADKILKMINLETSIFWEGIHTPVSSDRIQNAIAAASYLLMPYEVNESIQSCIPTKCYDALRYQTPMLMSSHELCRSEFEAYKAIFFLDFDEDVEVISKKIVCYEFYDRIPLKESYDWEFEGKKLIKHMRLGSYFSE